jgi:hypothetical protein
MTEYDPLLTTKESHQLGFNIDEAIEFKKQVQEMRKKK